MADDILVRHVQDLAESWQSKVLRETCHIVELSTLKPKDHIGAVVLSIFGHGLDNELPILLASVFPGFYTIGAPFLCTAGRIDKRGYIVADAVMRDNQPVTKDCIIFYGLRAMESALRRLSDHLRLNDTDRVKLFTAAKSWVVADRRLDPNMDPRDPDARRLTVH